METKEFQFNFTFEEVDTIFKALQELPFRKVNGIVNKMIKSYEVQTFKPQ